MIRKLFVLVSIALVASVFASTARAHFTSQYYYNWLWPSQGQPSSFDGGSICDAWYRNDMNKDNTGNNGTVTFIKSNGSWSWTITSTASFVSSYIYDVPNWVKKAYCYNSSLNTVYYVRCVGWHSDYSDYPGCV